MGLGEGAKGPSLPWCSHAPGSRAHVCRYVSQKRSTQWPLLSPPLLLTRLKSIPCQVAVSHSEPCLLLCAKVITTLYPPVGTCGKKMSGWRGGPVSLSGLAKYTESHRAPHPLASQGQVPK